MQKILIIFIMCASAVCAGQAFGENRGHGAISQGFSIAPISDSLLSVMKQGGSWRADTPASLRSELRHVRVLYFGTDKQSHHGELVVNARIAQDVVEIFDSLYRARYEIEEISLIDRYGADDERSMAANNTSAFCYRLTEGSRTRISLHGQGLAIDLNPRWNPYVKGSVVKPRGASRYPRIDHRDLAYRLFIAHGFRWGGDWRSLKDYQHFEKRF